PGPGSNSAGLAVFEYVTRCGTVYGHTGSFPGFGQLAVSNRAGSRSMTFSINTAPPRGRLLRRLRAMQETGVCALLKD
nr:peptidase S12 [Thermoleophilaceae bacterium]